MKEFFSDTGTLSMMRLVTFVLILLVAAIVLSMIFLTAKGKPTGELLTLVGIVLPCALGAKALQSKFENQVAEIKQPV